MENDFFDPPKEPTSHVFGRLVLAMIVNTGLVLVAAADRSWVAFAIAIF